MGLQSRVGAIRRSLWSTNSNLLHWTEIAFLLGCGLLASFLVLGVEFKWKLPGHSILRVVFPMAFGFAMVPRRGAGTTMGIGAVSGAMLAASLNLGDRGMGATTSLILTGPFLDLALRQAQSGFRVYASFIAAGLFSNVAAMLVQTVAKLWHLDSGGGKPVWAWLQLAGITYPVFGIVAGLISAAVWFRYSSPDRESPL